MTIIAGAIDKENKKTYIAADSLITMGMEVRSLNKLITINDNIIGYSGYLRLRDIIIENKNLYECYIEPKDILELIREDWIETKDKDHETSILLATKKKLYVMYPNQTILDFNDYVMIGSGSDVCRAVYYNNRNLLKLPVKQSLELAMKATIANCNSTGGKINIKEIIW